MRLFTKLKWIGCLAAAGVLLPFGTNPSSAQEEKWETVFFEANQAYDAGDYRQAVAGYRRLTEAGYGGGHVFFNLGNACFRLDELGEAILNYERAKLLIPRNPDLNFNLRYAKDRIVDSIDREESFLAATFFWLDSVNGRELFWIFAVANILLWILLLLRRFVRAEWLYYALLIAVPVWGVSGLSLGLKWYQVVTDHRAVVVEKEINVFSGPDRGDTVLFQLHEGSVVDVERSEGKWSLIRLSEHQRGWAAPGTVMTIRSTPSSPEPSG